MITLTATERHAKARVDGAVTTGSVGLPVTLSLSHDFDGLAVTVVFEAGDAKGDVAVLGGATEIEVPPQVLATAGVPLRIGVYARDAAGTIVIPTVWASAGTIRLGAAPSGIDPVGPTPSWAAQVQEWAEDAAESAGSAAESASTAQGIAESLARDAEGWAEAEQGRVTAEQARVLAEQGRTSAETERVAAEQARQSAETSRSRAEGARTQWEAQRVENEVQRVAAEASRADAWYTMRQDVESATAGAENVNATASKSGSVATVTVTDRDGNEHSVELRDGSDGADGRDGRDGTDGADGYSPSAAVTKSGSTATITITDKSGTTTASVSDGQDGADGTSPTASVQRVEGGAQVTVTDASGTTTAMLYDAEIAEGSVTDAMLAPDGIKAQVGYLTNDAVRQFDTLEPYLYKRDTYIANGNVDTALAGYDTYKVPVKQGDLIVMHWSETFWGGLSKGFYVLTVELADETITRIAIDASNVRWYRFSSYTNQGIARMPEDARYFVVTAHRAEFDAITDFMVNTPNVVLNDGTTVRRLQTLVDIDETCAGRSRIFFSTASNGTGAVNDPYSTFLLPVRSGDKIRFSGRESGFSYYGTFTSIADETTVQITTSDFTAPDDGILCEFPYVDGSPNATIIAADSIKIDASNVVNAAEPSFSGIKWVSFGDSITAQNKWQPHVVNALGMSHTNCGIGSTPLSGSNANAFWQTVRLDAVKAANPDIVTILGGANDLVLNPVIGTEANLSDKDTSTFIGAYSYIIDNLLTWKPSLRIFILSTTWAHDDGASYSQTVTYGQFAAACKKVAEYYKLPLVDLYDNSGFNAYTMGSSPNDVYSADHIHPNDKGARIIASQVIAKMLEVMRVR